MKFEVELSARERETLDELAERIGTDPATVIRMALWDMALENEIEDGPHSSLSGPEWFSVDNS